MKARNWRRRKQRRSQRRDRAMARYWRARAEWRGIWVWVAHSPIAVRFVIRRSDGEVVDAVPLSAGDEQA